MSTKIFLYDTTLRDGAQSEDVNLSQGVEGDWEVFLIATTWQDFSFDITWVNAIIQNFFQLTLCFKDCSHTST